MPLNKVPFPRALLAVCCLLSACGFGLLRSRSFSQLHPLPPHQPLSFLQRIDSRDLGFLFTNTGLRDQTLKQRQTEIEPGRLSANHCPPFWVGVYPDQHFTSTTGYHESICSGRDPLSCALLPGGLEEPALQSSHLSLKLLSRRFCPEWNSAGLLQQCLTSC